MVPGEGQFDVLGFLDTLDQLDVSRPISLEVISLHLDQMPPDDVARRVADGARSVLDRLRSRSQPGRRPDTT